MELGSGLVPGEPECFRSDAADRQHHRPIPCGPGAGLFQKPGKRRQPLSGDSAGAGHWRLRRYGQPDLVSDLARGRRSFRRFSSDRHVSVGDHRRGQIVAQRKAEPDPGTGHCAGARRSLSLQRAAGLARAFRLARSIFLVDVVCLIDAGAFWYVVYHAKTRHAVHLR